MDMISVLRTIIEQLERPAFIVCDGFICAVNKQADELFIQPHLPIQPLLGAEYLKYAVGENGPFLINLSRDAYLATLSRIEQNHLFILEEKKEENTIQLEKVLNMARSLRFPLDRMIAGANRLFPYLEEQEDEFIQANTAKISRAYYELLRNISTVETACALELRQQSLQCRTTEICGFLRDLTKDAEGFCEECGVKLQVQLPEEPFFGMIDRDLTERAILQLLNNALQQMPGNGVIEVRLEKTEAQIQVRIQYNDSAPKLFGIANTASKEEDTGFDLRFVQTVAELHGGSLTILSVPGTGTTELLSLPKTSLYGDGVLYSPSEVFQYGTELDQAHVAFSNVMPDSAYDSRCI